MKSLTSMTPVERIEEILQICHGLTIADIETAIKEYKTTKVSADKFAKVIIFETSYDSI